MKKRRKNARSPIDEKNTSTKSAQKVKKQYPDFWGINNIAPRKSGCKNTEGKNRAVLSNWNHDN